MSKIIKISRKQTEELGCSLLDFCSTFLIGHTIPVYMNSLGNRSSSLKIGGTTISTLIYKRLLKDKRDPYITVLSEVWIPTELNTSSFVPMFKGFLASEQASVIYINRLLWKTNDGCYTNRFNNIKNVKRLNCEIKSMLIEKAIEEVHI